jgi:hypothetical protein
MSGQLTTPLRVCAGTSTRELPTTHWTSSGAVGWPGQEHRRIDEVVTGPSGVHVVLHRAGHSSGTVADDLGLLAPLADEAGAAADAVAGLLPERYRAKVTAVVCLCGTLDVGEVVGGVLVASPSVLRHSWRHGPRRLSTSEVGLVSTSLDDSLWRVPVSPERGAGRWVARLRWWLTAAAVSSAAGVSVVVGLGIDPWR